METVARQQWIDRGGSIEDWDQGYGRSLLERLEWSDNFDVKNWDDLLQ